MLRAVPVELNFPSQLIYSPLRATSMLYFYIILNSSCRGQFDDKPKVPDTSSEESGQLAPLVSEGIGPSHKTVCGGDGGGVRNEKEKDPYLRRK